MGAIVSRAIVIFPECERMERIAELHLTIGRLEQPAAFSVALSHATRLTDTFATVVCEIAVYRIGPGATRAVECTVPLPPALPPP